MIPRFRTPILDCGIVIPRFRITIPRVWIVIPCFGIAIPCFGSVIPCFGFAIRLLRIAIPYDRIRRTKAESAFCLRIVHPCLVCAPEPLRFSGA